jgi:Arc/MetJ-type ribon-helix-helix transcriptional regulator
MPNLVVRITDTEMAALEAAVSRAGHKSKSDYVRETLALREQGGDLAERLEALERDHDRRIRRLEGMAGLD